MRRRPLMLAGVALVAATASGVTWHALRASPPSTSRAQSPNQKPAPRVASSAVTPSATSARSKRRAGNMDLHFLVYSDTHFGFDVSEKDASGRPRDPVKAPEGVEAINLAAITDMNAMATKPWPTAFGGTIGTPRGVLVSGDLTEEGDPWQWRHFVAFYGLKGGDGLLRYPVFEGHGNHDKHHSWYVLDRIRERHGATHYSFDWDDLFVACLGEAPDDTVLGWLKSDLAAVGRERPVLVYQHFPLLGPWSEGQWFAEGNYREKLRETLDGYNIVALFHGHYHASGYYRWHGIDVYNVGAAKHGHYSFAVVRVTDSRLRVAEWRFMEDRWEWWHEKPINGGSGAVIEGGRHAYSDD